MKALMSKHTFALSFALASAIALNAFAQDAPPATAAEALPPLPASSAAAIQAAPAPSATTPAAGPTQESANASSTDPRVHHSPVSVATFATELKLRVAVEQAHRVRQLRLVYRTAGSPQLRDQPFKMAIDGSYTAILSEAEMSGAFVEYAIELETVDGQRKRVFADRNTMHRIQIPPDLGSLQEAALLKRLGGRRSVFSSNAEYVRFGSTSARVMDPQTQKLVDRDVSDQYYRVEGGYTYRPLGFVSEFSLRVGVVRGRSVVANETDINKYDVGLNYGAPSVRLRMSDDLHIEGELLTSVTEVGFSLGTGGAVLIGDPYGTKLTLGFETIQTFGTRFYSRLDIVASDKMIVAPIIEATDMPHADRYGIRLLTEVRYDIGGGLAFSARGGYQARVSTSGGIAAGGALSYSF